MNKALLILTLITLGFLPVFADYDESRSAKWDSRQEQAIGNVSKIYVDFNTDKTIYCDLPLKDENNSEARTTIKKFGRWVLKAMNNESNSIEFILLEDVDAVTDNDFIATISLLEITEKGGVTCKMELIQKKNPLKPKVYTNLRVKDRKWNSTENLLKENAPKLGEQLESDLWWTSRNGRTK